MSDAANQAIKAFDASDAMKQLRSKLKLAFVELIPEEQWEALLRDEFQKFTRASTHNGQRVPSGLEVAAQEVLQGLARERIKTVLNSPEWVEQYLNAPDISEAVKDYLVEHQEKIVQIVLKNLIGGSIQDIVQDLKLRIQGGY